MNRVLVLAAAQEAGAANALIPVIEMLQRHAAAQVAIVACAQAAEVFAHAGFSPRVVGTPTPQDHRLANIEQCLEGTAPDVLLLGTSWGWTLDKTLLALGNARALPSVAIVDHWSHYRQRFLDPQSNALMLPTMIAVPDQRALAQAIREGLPSEAMVTTGHPHLARVARAITSPALGDQAQAIRRQWLEQMPSASRVVLFVSEPFSRFHGPGSAHRYDFTEVDALDGIAEALQHVEQTAGLRAALVIKRHPRDATDPLQLGVRAASQALVADGELGSLPCCVAADVVIGMSSMVLLESVLAGRPTISFRPTRKAPEFFVGVARGLVAPAFSVEQLIPRLADALRGIAAINHESLALAMSEWSPGPGSPAARIADLVLELAATGAKA